MPRSHRTIMLGAAKSALKKYKTKQAASDKARDKFRGMKAKMLAARAAPRETKTDAKDKLAYLFKHYPDSKQGCDLQAELGDDHETGCDDHEAS